MKKMTKKKNIKIKTNIIDSEIAALRGNRIDWWPLTKQDNEKYIFKSTRSDYGKTVDIRIPQGYHAQVQKTWEMYSTDRLFRYLIDRCVDFGANGFEWEVPLKDKKGFFANLLIGKINSKNNKDEKEKAVWDYWAANINANVPNVMTGIDEINGWIIKHLLLGGMSPLSWIWESVEINGETYTLPTKMTILNSTSIALDRKNDIFTDESMFLKINKRKIRDGGSNETVVSLYSLPQLGASFIELDIMGVKKNAQREAFAIKYNWSPGDNTTLVAGKSVSVGQGLYPIPPFVGLFDTLVVRRALQAADIAILDGVINYIIDWSIGDNTTVKMASGKEIMPNQPRPAKKAADGTVIEKSSIEMAKETITANTRGNLMQLFHPYYYKIDIKMPDTGVLINADKYVQTTLEVYEAFGIFMNPPTAGKNDFTDINVQNFEELLTNIRRRHVKRFWESLCSEVVKRNEGKLTVIPNYIFNPLNTKSDAFKESLRSLMKMGKVSNETLLKAHSVDKDVEVIRIAREMHTKESDLFNANVPLTYVQTTVTDKDKKNIGVSSGKQGGRPIKGEEKK